MKQKTINNRQLIVAFLLAVVLAFGLMALLGNTKLINPNWNFFIDGTASVLVLSMFLHLFYFSWLSGMPMKRLPPGSAVPLKRLVAPTVGLHLLVIILAAVLFFWNWPGLYQNNFGEEVLGLLFFLLFGGCEMFLLGTRWFAPVFSGLNVVWRIPVLMLGGGVGYSLWGIAVSAPYIGL